MAHFAAIEIKPGEHVEQALRSFLSVAAELRIRFRTLEVFGILSYAGVRFVRFRTDCPTYPPIVARYRFEQRGIIVPTRLGFNAFVRDRHGAVRGAVMHVASSPGYGRVYQGPAEVGWSAQFG